MFVPTSPYLKEHQNGKMGKIGLRDVRADKTIDYTPVKLGVKTPQFFPYYSKLKSKSSFKLFHPYQS